jgi:ribosomal protein S12 methylthiotransferase accessory factor
VCIAADLYLGPIDPLRTEAAERLLPLAEEAGRIAGVTRLAEVTHLDRIGLPVWQAIRPMSRALSVHQGKGASDADARLGALLEAFESHSAESYPDAGPLLSFDRIPVPQRPPDLADFAVDRAAPPAIDAPCRWVEAEDLLTGGTICIPWDCVSLDLTRNVPSAFDRASNGIAAGATREEAISVALHEFIERDAVTEWKAGGLLACMERSLDTDQLSFPWLGRLRERIEGAGASLQLYSVPSLTGTPVIACEISDLGKDGAPYRSIQGRGCHPIPELALFKAISEAVQGRATYIAGAREDLPPSDYQRPQSISVAFGLPLPPGMEAFDFEQIEEGPVGIAALADALARAGYPRIAIVDLAQTSGISVVRVFACGLGGIKRRRRLA